MREECTYMFLRNLKGVCGSVATAGVLETGKVRGRKWVNAPRKSLQNSLPIKKTIKVRSCLL